MLVKNEMLEFFHLSSATVIFKACPMFIHSWNMTLKDYLSSEDASHLDLE